MKTSTPLFRISLGLVFITTSLLFTMDMLGVLPSEGQQQVESRLKKIINHVEPDRPADLRAG